MSWFVALALAAPPEGVVPDDLTTWETRSQALLDGPPGCWELSGRLDLTASGYVPASRWSRPDRRDHHLHGTFTGRLDAGTWTSFRYTLEGEGSDDPDVEIPLFPMTGRIDPDVAERIDTGAPSDSTITVDAGGDAVNTLRRVLDAIDPATETIYAEWSEDRRAVRLYRDVPLEKGSGTVTVETLFPEGGLATSLDATFPRRVKVGDGLVKVTVFDGQMHLRAQQVGDLVVPALESLSVGLGALGFTGAYEQKLTYEKAVRCTVQVGPPAPDPVPPAE